MPEDTKLSPLEELAFQRWLQTNKDAPGVRDFLMDPVPDDVRYDIRGFFRDKPKLGQWYPGAHGPDTFKQHGHPTFSTESKYAAGPADAGTWGENDTFYPPGTDQLWQALASNPSSLDPDILKSIDILKQRMKDQPPSLLGQAVQLLFEKLTNRPSNP